MAKKTKKNYKKCKQYKMYQKVPLTFHPSTTVCHNCWQNQFGDKEVQCGRTDRRECKERCIQLLGLRESEYLAKKYKLMRTMSRAALQTHTDTYYLISTILHIQIRASNSRWMNKRTDGWTDERIDAYKASYYRTCRVVSLRLYRPMA